MLKFDRLSEGRDDEVVKDAALDIGGGRNSDCKPVGQGSRSARIGMENDSQFP
jgi:hypothetical protein